MVLCLLLSGNGAGVNSQTKVHIMGPWVVGNARRIRCWPGREGFEQAHPEYEVELIVRVPSADCAENPAGHGRRPARCRTW
jgi:hypothetical protein